MKKIDKTNRGMLFAAVLIATAFMCALGAGLFAVSDDGYDELYAAPVPQSENTVAMIGNVEYEDLQTAINSASPGATLELVKDFEDPITVSNEKKYIQIDHSIVINGNGHTFKGMFNINNYGPEASKEITVKISNLIFDGLTKKDGTPDITRLWAIWSGNNHNEIGVQTPVNLTLEDCKINNYNNKGVYLSNVKTLTVNRCDFNYTGDNRPISSSYGDYSLDINLISTVNEGITITNCKFAGESGGNGPIKITQRGTSTTDDNEGYASNSTINKVTLSGNQFNETNKNTVKGDIIFGSTPKTVMKTYNVAFDVDLTSKGDTSVCYRGYMENSVEHDLRIYLGEGDTLKATSQTYESGKTMGKVDLKTSGAIKGTLDCIETNCVRIGETYYSSLEEAVTSAASDSTIEILNDIYTGPNRIDIDKNITIKSPVGSKNTVFGAFLLDSSGSEGTYAVTFNNMIFNGSGTLKKAVEGNNQADNVRPVNLNVTDCEIRNYTYKGIYLTNVQSLSIDGCSFFDNATDEDTGVKGDYAVDVNLVGITNATIEIKNCTFGENNGHKSPIKITQRGGVGLTDDVNTDIHSTSSATIFSVEISDNVFSDAEPAVGHIVLGSSANEDKTTRSYTTGFDASITSKGNTVVSYRGGNGGGDAVFKTVLGEGGVFKVDGRILLTEPKTGEAVIIENTGVASGGLAAVDDAVAKIGTDYYTTLDAAILAVQDNETITLLSDVGVSSTVVIGKNINLDLGNFRLYSSSLPPAIGKYSYLINITGTVTIKNGTVTSEHCRVMKINGAGDVTLESVEVSAKGGEMAVQLDDTGKLNVKAGSTVTSETGTVIGIYGPESGAGPLLDISGTVARTVHTHQTPAIADSYTWTSNSIVNVREGASVSAVGTAAFGVYNLNSVWNIYGGTFQSDSVFLIKNGTINIEGGTFESKQVTPLPAGSSVNGSCFSFDPHHHVQGNAVTVTISGGSFSSDHYAIFQDSQISDIKNGRPFGTDIQIDISNGIFTCKDNSKDVFAWLEGTESNVSVTGGTFSSDPSGYIDKEHYSVSDANGNFEVVNESTKYTVNLIVDGVQDSTQAVVHGATVSTPDVGTKAGYTLMGWYTEAQLTNKVEFPLTVTSDISLYAEWKVNDYTITFESNGGSSVESITAAYGSKVVAPADPIKNGYSFVGWYESSEFNGSTFVFETMPLNGTTLYAKWISEIAETGGVKYPSLSAAVEAVVPGSTVTLLANTDITNGGITVSKSLTLDLNGFRITANNSSGGDVVQGNIIITDGTFTLMDSGTNGSIVASTPYLRGSYGSGVVKVIGEDTKFVMESGTIKAVCEEDPTNKGQFGVVIGFGADVTINGGKIEAGWYALSGNGNNKTQNSVIDINGGELISTADYSIYLPHSGSTTIDGGKIYGAAGGIAINRGNLTINAGEITSKGTGSTGDWGDGTGNMNAAALNIKSAYGDSKVSITGGTLTAELVAVMIDEIGAKGDLTITGGIFSSDPSSYIDKAQYSVTDASGKFEVVKEPTKYTVTIDSGAYGSVDIPTLQVIHGTEVKVERNKLLFGNQIVIATADPATDQYAYTFDSWTPEVLPGATVTGPVTYTAQFVSAVIEYTITFVDGDGNTLQTGEVAYNLTPVYTGEVPTKTATPEFSYTFNGQWQPAIEKVTGDQTYVAQFTSTPNVAKVGDAYYTSLQDALTDAASGSEIVLLSDATATALAIDKNITIKGDGVKKIAGKFVLDAGSSTELYTVEFDGVIFDGNGTEKWAIIGENEGTNTVRPVDLTLNNCGFDHYTQKCIYLTNAQALTVTDCTFKYGFDEAPEYGDYALDLNLIGVKDAVITVTGSDFNGYVKNGAVKVTQRGAGSSTDDAGNNFANDVSATVASVTLSGNTFTNTNDSVKGDIVIGSSPGTAMRTYNVAFDLNITSEGKTVVCYRGDKVEGTENMFVVTLQDGQTYTAVGEIVGDETKTGSVSVKTDGTVSGQVPECMTVKMDVTFDMSGHGTDSKVEVDYGSKVSEPEAPTAVGYTFAGWFSDESFGTAYDFDTVVESNIVLYAKWTVTQYDVTFDPANGTASTVVSVNHGEKVPVADVPKPVRSGYDFAGWYESGEAVDPSTKTITAETTFVAHWSVHVYPQPDPEPPKPKPVDPVKPDIPVEPEKPAEPDKKPTIDTEVKEETKENEDGSTTTEKTETGKTEKGEDVEIKTETTVNKDGSSTQKKDETVKDVNGNETNKTTETTVNKDGSSSTKQTETKKDSEGNESTKVVETEIKADGTTTQKETATETSKDGSKKEIDTTTTVSKDGQVTQNSTTTHKDESGKVQGTVEKNVVTETNAKGETTVTTQETVKDEKGEVKASTETEKVQSKDEKGNDVVTETTTVKDSKGETTHVQESETTVKKDVIHGTTTQETNTVVKDKEGKVNSKTESSVVTDRNGNVTENTVESKMDGDKVTESKETVKTTETKATGEVVTTSTETVKGADNVVRETTESENSKLVTKDSKGLITETKETEKTTTVVHDDKGQPKQTVNVDKVVVDNKEKKEETKQTVVKDADDKVKETVVEQNTITKDKDGKHIESTEKVYTEKITDDGKTEKEETINMATTDGKTKTEVAAKTDSSGKTEAQAETVVKSEGSDVSEDVISKALKQTENALSQMTDKPAEVRKTVAVDTGSKTAVSIAPAAVKSISDTGAGLAVKGDDGDIHLDDSICKTLTSDKDAKVSVSMKHNDVTELSDKQKDIVGKNHFVNLAASIGDEKVHQLGGTATVTFDYQLKDGQEAAKLKVYYVDDDGKKTEIESAFENGRITVKTTHFSVFMVAQEAEPVPVPPVEPDTPVVPDTPAEPEDEGGSNIALYAGVAVAVIAILAVVAFLYMRNRS